MKLCIAGSRDLDITNRLLDSLIRHQFKLNPSEIVSGHCPTGVDKAGEDWYKYITNPEYGVCFDLTNQFTMKLKLFKPDWERDGKAAGPIRNRFMAEYADALLLIWDGSSKGSASMKKEMLKLGKPIYEIIVNRINEEEQIFGV